MQPRDFLSDDNEMQNTIGNEPMGRDFLQDFSSDQPQESYGWSAALAVPRVTTDLLKRLYNVAKSVPQYAESAKTEIPGYMKLLFQRPDRFVKQGLAGLAEQGQNVFNTPHDLLNYATNRLNLVPKNFNEHVQMSRMPDSSQEINQFFGEPKYPGEKLLRGLTGNSLALIPSAKIAASLNPINLTSNKSLSNSITNTHDFLENRAIKGFENVSKEAYKRGISKVPIESTFIDNLKEFFPKTRQANQLLEKAKNGDYDSLRKIQSELYTKGKDSLKSPLESERLRASEIFEKRNDINQSISNHLQNLGHTDLDKILNNARQDYSTLQKIYYNPKMNRSIINMVDRDFRKVPKNLVKILQENSNPMKQLRSFHPGLENNLNKYLYKQSAKNALSTLSELGIPLGIGALGAAGAMKYMDLSKK